jgi:hypothetical protein
MTHKKHLTAHCEDCGANPGEYCSPICQQDCKDPNDVQWRTNGIKPDTMLVQVLVTVAGEDRNKWVTLAKECRSFRLATNMVNKYKKDHGYIKARVTQNSKQTWITP